MRRGEAVRACAEVRHAAHAPGVPCRSVHCRRHDSLKQRRVYSNHISVQKVSAEFSIPQTEIAGKGLKKEHFTLLQPLVVFVGSLTNRHVAHKRQRHPRGASQH